MSTRRPRLPSAPPLTADDEARIRRQMSQAQYEDIQRRLEAYTFYYSQALQLAAQLKTTQRYAHLSQATLLEAVEVVVEAAGLTVEMLE
ncbi:hypothetical protein HW932_15950 [Allochromatium humboldtianum]|uniref:Uncharacterized protein n=1 Tax=Allochromatium humboldtianum TaxID=504901 RepID=A0A850RBR0_9GAMM|nr:hypothetical protein [Allochromatium humboldtianum]NVZ10758.1 hypothetical protein [Allochromatium humboldtianum]